MSPLECRTEGLNLHTTARIATMRSTTSVTFSNSHRAPDEVITTFKVTICLVPTFIDKHTQQGNTLYFDVTQRAWSS